jgi:NADH dehydrogenase
VEGTVSDRIVVLGGGFAGIYTAKGLDKVPGLDVTLINRENFFLFTPMLSEIATGGIETRHGVNPIRRMFRRVRFMEAEVASIDFDAQNVAVTLPNGTPLEVPYDHLVLTLGSVPNYFGLPGVAEHSLPLKTLADAVRIRNLVIENLEIADVSPPSQRADLLTFVVAGGGLSGVELAGDLNDYLREAARAYRTIEERELRVILAEAGPRLIPELGGGLGDFARRKLIERGVHVRLNAPVERASDTEVRVGGETIQTRTLLWLAGIAPVQSVSEMSLPVEKGRVLTDETMRVVGRTNVWAAGDAARIPDGRGGFHPPTAQHAIREGSRLAKNIILAVQGDAPQPFRYTTMGMLATVGHTTGVAELMGVRVSGFPAWFLWRTYYLMRLPRWEKRVRVLFDWTLDLIFPRDIVQLPVIPKRRDPRATEE